MDIRHTRTYWLIGVIVLLGLFLGYSPGIQAQDDPDAELSELEELEALLEEDVVQIASKTPESVTKAPATVTVITAEQIRNMNARNLTEVLVTIPGVEAFIQEYGYTEIVIRGGRHNGERVKFLINGHSVNPPRTGQPAIFWDDLTMENVKRIEVIRGPGSALYGTNAFNGVINVITKDADEIDGVEVIAKGGSYDSWTTGLLFGHTLGDLKISGYAEYADTDGADSILERDAQTVLDEMYAPYGIPPASLAPGEVKAYREKTDISVDMEYHDLTLHARYLKKRQGPYIGANYTLNHDSQWDLDYFFVEGRYDKAVSEAFDISLKASWDRVTEDYYIQGSPEGFTIPLDLDGDGDIEVFPEGRYGRMATSFDTFGGEFQATYRPGDNHVLVGGGEVQKIRQFDNIANSNFDRLTIAALDPGELDTTPTFEDDNSRTIVALFLQDQWQMTDDIRLTLGVRYDHYSDFGDTVNPRAAFVWNVIPDLHLKVLYGQAFLAPNFHQLYLKNNPLTVGSEDLDPMTIQTFEIGASYQISKQLTANLAYFYNRDDDLIVAQPQPDPNEPGIYVNGEGDIVQGVEVELKAEIEDRFQGYVNYTYRDTEIRDTGDDVPFASQHLGRLGMNVPIMDYLNANLRTSFVGEKPRQTGDERETVDGYVLVDATLTARNLYKGLEVFASVYNLFDTEYTSPSIANSFPDDYPMPGRTFWAGLRYNFTSRLQ